MMSAAAAASVGCKARRHDLASTRRFITSAQESFEGSGREQRSWKEDFPDPPRLAITEKMSTISLTLVKETRRVDCSGVIVPRFSISVITYSLFSRWLRRVLPFIACRSPSRMMEFVFFSNIRRLCALLSTFATDPAPVVASILSFT